MSTTVDNRVVSLKFDNSGFSNKVSETRKQLEGLNKDLSLDNAEKGSSKLQSFFDRFQNGIEKLTLDPIKNSVQSVQVEFSKFDAFVSGMFIKLGQDAMAFGEKFVKSLSIDNVLDGYREYELKMESMKVIMASNTKYSLGQVNGYLEELNEYADKTIYKFSDMTTAIGRFVSMGVDVETATKAIQGASSLTALTGGGNAEAQRVMYNTSQALATGYMSLMDWRSMENARVSKQWYQQIMAVMKEYYEAGKLGKDASEFYVNAANNYGYFREKLKDKFVTKDIIVESLMKFSDETTALGQKALKAATEVTTFTKLLDTVKEGVGSTWARIFEDIFGNYEKSKKLWTELNDWLSSIFIEPLDALEGFIKKWSTAFVGFEKDSEGHITKVAMTAQSALIGGFQNILSFISSALGKIKEAWKAVFGETAVNYLVQLTAQFHKWTENLKNNQALLEKIKSVAESVFKVIKFIKNIITAIGKVLVKVVWPVVKVIFKFIFSIASAIAKVLGSLADGLSSFISGLFGTTKTITKVQAVTEDMTSSIEDADAALKDATSALDEYNDLLSDTASSTSKTTKATEKAAKELEAYRELFAAHGLDLDTMETNNGGGVEETIQWYKDTLKAIGMNQATIDKYVEMVKNTGRAFTYGDKIFYPHAKGAGYSYLDRMFGDIFDAKMIDDMMSEWYPKYTGDNKTIQANIEKAMKSGSFISGDYFYSYYGKAIPIDEIVKYAQDRDRALSLHGVEESTKKSTKAINKTLIGSGINSYLDTTVKTLRLFPTLTSSKVQNGIKEIGKGTEKALSNVTKVTRGISRSGTLYKALPGIRKATENIFKANDRVFKNTNTGIINFSKRLQGLVKKTSRISGLNLGFGRRESRNSSGMVSNANKAATASGTAAANSATASANASKAAADAKATADKLDEASNISEDFVKSFKDELDAIESTPDKLKFIGQKVANKLEEDVLEKAVEKSYDKVLEILGKKSESIDMTNMTTTDKIFTATDQIVNIFRQNISKETKDEIKEIFSDIGGIFLELIRIVKEFFSILGISFKDAKKQGKGAAKESNNFFDKFKMAVHTVHEFVAGIRAALESVRLIDSETGELTERGKKVKRVTDVIVQTIKLIGAALLLPIKLIKKIGETIERLKKGESFTDIFGKGIGEFLEKLEVVKDKIKRFFSIVWTFFNDIKNVGIKKALENLLGNVPSEWAEAFGRMVYRVYNLKDTLKEVKEHISKFFENWKEGGLKFAIEQEIEGLPDTIQHLFDIIAEKFEALGDRIKKYIEETSGEEFWKDLGDNQAVQFALSVGKFLLRVIGAGIKLAFDGLFKKYLKFVGLEDLIDSGQIENMTIWDKLKVIFGSIFDGSFAEAMNGTGVVDFIKWFVKEAFNAIVNKIVEIKNNILSLFGVDTAASDMGNTLETTLESLGVGKATPGFETLTKSLSEASEELDSFDGRKSPDWSKILGIGGFTLVAFKLLSTIKLLSNSTAVGNIGSNLTVFIGNISKAFAGFAAVATLTTIIEFAAVVFILVKAMSYLAEMDTNTIKANVEQLYGIMGRMIGLVGEIALMVLGLQSLSLVGDIVSVANGGSPLGKSTNYFWSIAAVIFTMGIGIAAIIAAVGYLSKVGNIDNTIKLIDKIFGNGMNDWGIIGKLFLALGAIVTIAGVLGIVTGFAEGKANTTNNVGSGKFSPVIQVGNVSKTVKQSPIAAVGSLITELGKMLIILLAGYAGLVLIMGIVLKLDNGEEILKRAAEVLNGMTITLIVVLAIIFGSLIAISAVMKDSSSVATMFKNLGGLIAALGYMLSSTIFALFLFIGKLGKEDFIDEEFKFTLKIIRALFRGLFSILVAILIAMYAFSRLGVKEEDGDKISKVIKATGKMIKSVVSPIKLIFAGIGLMMKLGAGLDEKMWKRVENIVQTVFRSIAVIVIALMIGLNVLLRANSGDIEKTAPLITKLIKSIATFLAMLMIPIVLIMGEVTAILAISNNVNEGIMGKVVAILAIIFGFVALILTVLLGSLLLMNKQRGGGEFQVFDKFVDIINAVSIFMGVLMGTIILLMGTIIAIAAISNNVNEGIMNKVIAILVIIFAAVALILVELFGGLMLLNKSRGKGGEYKVFDKFVDIIHAISLFLLALAAAVVLMMVAVAGLALVLNKVTNPGVIDKVMWTLGIIFAAVAILMAELVGSLIALNKNKVDASSMLKFVGVFAVFLAAVVIFVGLMAVVVAGIALAFSQMGDTTMVDKAMIALAIIIAGVMLLFAEFAVAVGVLSKLGVDPIGMLAFSAAFVIMSLAMVAIAGAFVLMAGATKDLSTGRLVGIVAIFAAFILILTGLGLVSLYLTGGTLGPILISIAGALLLMGLSILAIGGAIWLTANAFEIFFELIRRLPELLVPITVFLTGLRTLVLPAWDLLMLDFIDMTLGHLQHLIDGVIDLITEEIPHVIAAFLKMVNDIYEAIREALNDNEETGEQGLISNFIGIITDIINGIADNLDEVSDAMENFLIAIADMIVDLATTAGRVVHRLADIPGAFIRGMFETPEGEEQGVIRNIVDGFFDGIEAAWADNDSILAKGGLALIKQLRDVFDIESPSKVMKWIGKMVMKGFSEGIDDKSTSNGIMDTVTGLKDKVLGALNTDGEEGGMLDGLMDSIQDKFGNMDLTSTMGIDFVYDMDQFKDMTGSMDINGMLNGYDMSGYTADSFNSMQTSQANDALTNQNGTGDTYNVTTMQQNNYSPKAIDSATNYRQSNNLINASLHDDRSSGFKPTNNQPVERQYIVVGGTPSRRIR